MTDHEMYQRWLRAVAEYSPREYADQIAVTAEQTLTRLREWSGDVWVLSISLGGYPHCKPPRREPSVWRPAEGPFDCRNCVWSRRRWWPYDLWSWPCAHVVIGGYSWLDIIQQRACHAVDMNWAGKLVITGHLRRDDPEVEVGRAIYRKHLEGLLEWTTQPYWGTKMQQEQQSVEVSAQCDVGREAQENRADDRLGNTA